MSIFEYLMVLLSVVLSLGLVHVLNGLINLFHTRRRVTWSAVYLLWIVEVLMLHFDFWQYTWSLHSQTSFSQSQVAMMFLLVAAIYLTASSLVITPHAEGKTDLSVSWESVRREFLAIYIGYLVLVVILNITSYDEWMPMLWNIAVYVLPFILLAAIAFVVPHRRVQLIAIGGILTMDMARYVFIQPSIG